MTDTPLTPAELIANATRFLREGEQDCPFDGHGIDKIYEVVEPLARHILATLRADGHLPADAEWFAGLEGVLSKEGNYVHFKVGNLYGVALTVSKGIKVDIGPDGDSSRWWCWNPNRGAVRLACLSMGHTLQEVPS